MARSNKSSRRIVVDGVVYRWRLTDYTAYAPMLALTVWPATLPGATIDCVVRSSPDPGRWPGAPVTNAHVRQVIEASIQNDDYDPRESTGARTARRAASKTRKETR